jgi:DNA-binding transcriptional LysR family regulator
MATKPSSLTQRSSSGIQVAGSTPGDCGAVAEEQSFSAAARRLHVSQPLLSIQIKTMGDELGSRLFERTSRHVKLTEAGQLFLEEARRAMVRLDLASEVVRQASLGESGEIRVAFDATSQLLLAYRSHAPSSPLLRS